MLFSLYFVFHRRRNIIKRWDDIRLRVSSIFPGGGQIISICAVLCVLFICFVESVNYQNAFFNTV